MTNLAKTTSLNRYFTSGPHLSESISQNETAPEAEQTRGRIYNRDALTYSNTFENPFKRQTIRTIEWLTGKVSIVRMITEFERRPAVKGHGFWRACLNVMRIELHTPLEQLENIPATGPVIVVANHPHGMVDGMILAELIGKRRRDYRILTRSVLTGIDPEAAAFLIPVPFPHEEDAQQKFLEMRKQAMAHLKAGGVVALFPAGGVAASETMYGPAVDAEWNVFTAKMIRTSGATVVPCFFPGQNSRAYQMANQISATLRQGLLIHEIVKACGKPQAPIVGSAIDHSEVETRLSNPREFMAWLRDHTLSLGKS
ncbi:Acyltransferase [Cognatiyoonia sediminum]|uniref:Acyltransferase n=1 Tax=Cognatiyoonia sediminum TaxID=1508389 RepID=A0A1M5RL93_9RHOB|nr:Acyltransferase [Cognatiyoonia sediminum]